MYHNNMINLLNVIWFQILIKQKSFLYKSKAKLGYYVAPMKCSDIIMTSIFHDTNIRQSILTPNSRKI